MRNPTLRVLAWTVAWSAQILCMTGCSTMLRGTHQTVQLSTSPSGQAVYYEGRKIADGESIMIDKRIEDAVVSTDSSRGPTDVRLKYDPDPLLIVDSALLLLFIVPGVVALGVDFLTGAWRDYHDRQVVYVPEATEEEASR